MDEKPVKWLAAFNGGNTLYKVYVAMKFFTVQLIKGKGK